MIIVGLVPTMGSLHEGHIDLMKKSLAQNSSTIASLFINPCQFAPHEDFGSYPWNPEKDIELMLSLGVTNVFIPSVPVMYPNSSEGAVFHDVIRTLVTPVGIDQLSEGKSRPGFFTGVCTVVAKLLNIIQPNRAYFGEKDGLQLISVKRMVEDLNFPVQIISCPTIREPDGLAQSSRNIYLSKEQRQIAPILFQTLTSMKNLHNQNERNYSVIRESGLQLLKHPLFEVEYLSIASNTTGIEFSSNLPERGIIISAALRFSNCRIIDNILI